MLKRSKYRKNIYRRMEKNTIGLILLVIGITIIAVITLPYTIWMVLLGCTMVYIGYKLFI